MFKLFKRKKLKKYLIPTKLLDSYIESKIEESIKNKTSVVDNLIIYDEDKSYRLAIWNNRNDSSNKKKSIEFLFEEEEYESYDDFKDNCMIGKKKYKKHLQLVVSFPDGAPDDYIDYQVR